MAELCYETIQFSPFIDPTSEADLPGQIRAAGAAGFEWIGIDAPSVAQHRARGGTLEDLARELGNAQLRCLEIQPLIVGASAADALASARETAEIARALGAPWIQGGLTDPLPRKQPWLPLHEHCLFKNGIHLGEMFYFTELARWLRAHRRSRFLFTAPPLRLPGAVGSPATPIATV